MSIFDNPITAISNFNSRGEITVENWINTHFPIIEFHTLENTMDMRDRISRDAIILYDMIDNPEAWGLNEAQVNYAQERAHSYDDISDNFENETDEDILPNNLLLPPPNLFIILGFGIQPLNQQQHQNEIVSEQTQPKFKL